jgi:hypothetical protein
VLVAGQPPSQLPRVNDLAAAKGAWAPGLMALAAASYKRNCFRIRKIPIFRIQKIRIFHIRKIHIFRIQNIPISLFHPDMARAAAQKATSSPLLTTTAAASLGMPGWPTAPSCLLAVMPLALQKSVAAQSLVTQQSVKARIIASPATRLREGVRFRWG